MKTYIFNKETSINYDNDMEINRMFLASHEAYFNERFQIDGYVYLRDVLNILGFNKEIILTTSPLLGWSNIKDVITFGIIEIENGFELHFNSTLMS